jgi:hypothetical protein
VQFADPFAIGDIGLTAGHILQMAGVNQ